MLRSAIAAVILILLVVLGLALGPDRAARDTVGTAALVRSERMPLPGRGMEAAPQTDDPLPEAGIEADVAPELPDTEESAGIDELAAVDSLDAILPEAGPAADNAPPTDDAQAAADPDTPRFDLVRVTADGQILIAGQAAAGALVEVMLDGEVFGAIQADNDGTFVAILDAEPSDSPRRLVLRTGSPASDPARPDAADTGAAASPDVRLSDPVIILPGSEDVAPVLVRSAPEAVEVLQPAPAEEAELALDRITYRPGEDVTAAGRAHDARVVRAYANGRLIVEIPVAEDGEWTATIPHATARTTDLLRFDELSASGDVTARLEAPFDYREEGATQTLRQRRLTVERGNNLWRIAEAHYGDGIRYSIIFSANSDLIRNPDLIYPGQVFAIPELVEAE